VRGASRAPFFPIVVCYALGIVLDHFFALPFIWLCCVVVMGLFMSALIWRRPRMVTVALLISIAALGAVQSQGRDYPSLHDIRFSAPYYWGKPVVLEGVVVSDVEYRKVFNTIKTTFVFQVKRIKTSRGWRQKTGTVLVNMFREYDAFYGDVLRLEGKLHRPYNFSKDETFSYRDYLSRRNIYYIFSIKKKDPVGWVASSVSYDPMFWSLSFRRRLKNVLSAYLSGSEAGVMKAVLLGDRSAITKPIRALFVQTGTAHILAISGLHIGIIAGVFLLFVKMLPIGRRWQYVFTILLLIGYAFLTGSRPSVVRATLMMTIFLVGFIVEKEFNGFNALCLAALIILLINPFNCFDIGFQLSFICVLAILYLNSRIRRGGHNQWDRRGDGGVEYKAGVVRISLIIRNAILFSSVIWMASAGLVAYYFHVVTPVTVLANLLAVPFISIIVGLGIGLLVIGLVAPAFAPLLAVCLKVVLNVMVGLLFLCHKIPYAYISVKNLSGWQVGVYYVVLLVLIVTPWKRWGASFGWFCRGKIFPWGRIDKKPGV